MFVSGINFSSHPPNFVMIQKYCISNYNESKLLPLQKILKSLKPPKYSDFNWPAIYNLRSFISGDFTTFHNDKTHKYDKNFTRS